MKDKDVGRSGRSTDEADLYFLYQKLAELFRSIGSGITNFFRLMIDRKWLLVAFIFIGMGIGYAAYYSTKPYYTSTMTLMLANIRNEFIEDQLNKISIMVSEDNFEAVARRLDISLEEAREIKSMTYSNLDADRVDEDSVLTGSPFRIELALYDRNLFENMEPALTNFLEGNRYFAKQKRIKQQEIERLISKLDDEINSIDSIKTGFSEPRGPVNGFVYGQPLDPTNLVRESITLYKEQVRLEADLEKLDNVEVVNSFVPRIQPTGPSLRKYLALGALSAMLVGVIVAMALGPRKL